MIDAETARAIVRNRQSESRMDYVAKELHIIEDYINAACENKERAVYIGMHVSEPDKITTIVDILQEHDFAVDVTSCAHPEGTDYIMSLKVEW